MRSDRCALVLTALGFLALAAGAADGHELASAPRNDEWLLAARFELEWLGGLWLLCGLSPRWARISALAAFMGILACDVARAVAGYPPRYAFGRVVIGHGFMLGSDLIVVAALMRWRPAAASVPWIDSHPGRLAGTAAIAVALGAAIAWSQAGYCPMTATARSGGSSGSPGLDYLVYLPGGYYRSSGRWPLILYLHGAGDVGRGLARVRFGGLPRRIEEGRRLPFIVVAPCSPQHGWEPEALDALLNEVLSRYRVDAERVYLTGLSMGGDGTWALAAARPGRFAAIAPISGGGDPAWAGQLKGVPTWAFHGESDMVVLPEASRSMVEALERAGGDVRLTTYPRTGHDAWTRTYAEPELYAWFLAHRRRAAGEAAAPSIPRP
jgi:poly(3-hydroxybutyrate) depolymerase